jgi:ribosomal protein L29
MIGEDRLKELRGMTTAELAEEYNTPKVKAMMLKKAIQPGYFEILSNNNLTIFEMVEKFKSEISKEYVESTVNELRSGLTRFGLADKKVKRASPNRNIYKQTLEFLHLNPSKISKIRKNVKGFRAPNFYQHKKIASVGPWGHKIYYLKEEESIVFPKIEKLLDEIPTHMSEEKILNAVTKPISIEDLCKQIELSEQCTCKIIHDLEMNEKLVRVRRFSVGKRSEKACILKKDYVYKPGEEQEMANLIIPKITSEMTMYYHTKSKLTYSFRRNLRKPLFEIVHASYMSKSKFPVKIPEMGSGSKIIYETIL